jgi:hypothetical protein
VKLYGDKDSIGCIQHLIENSGAVTWDLPLSDDGIIPENYFKQVKALSNSINRTVKK